MTLGILSGMHVCLPELDIDISGGRALGEFAGENDFYRRDFDFSLSQEIRAMSGKWLFVARSMENGLMFFFLS